MTPKVLKLSLTTLVVSLLAACSAPNNNAPIYNISGTGQYAGTTQQQTTSTPVQNTNTSSINPSFSVNPAEENSSVYVNDNASNTVSSNVNTVANNVNTVTNSASLQACEATQPFVIPRDADNKPIYSRIQKGSYTAKNYVVQQSDTLFLLGYISGTSDKEVARINNLSLNSVLTPGTVLVLNPNACNGASVQQQVTAPVATTVNASKQAVQTTTSSAQQQAQQQAQKVQQQATQATQPVTASTTNTTVTSQPQQTTTSQTQAAQTVQAQGQATGSNALMWPANGRVIQTYSNKDGSDHSIHIAGTIGDKIYASQDGHVIYEGVYNKYGNTVIINHNNSMLTVYACNSSNKVKANQTVKKGDVIALMGNTCGKGTTMLFYQVRVNGNTVDPLKYLAKR
ncbi:hypothetical protein CKF54_01750 [Psittacicella hinzii]|uniref:LysM domain-containing protein n=1 Tax=Psittacicella hinzii TaxID=2028575 RepID=A0A3A1Y9F5_9GAMM|nr:peptidoglycan DD-metalloendopeptidase family protein [Psittacicella hinzii]RIY34181.1 hypothetical protein CKF54_01750 [Psittacicella hinzii]